MSLTDCPRPEQRWSPAALIEGRPDNDQVAHPGRRQNRFPADPDFPGSVAR